MTRKTLYLVLTLLLATAGNALAQNNHTTLPATDDTDLIIDDLSDYEDEIDNYDFLYTGTEGATYDEVAAQGLLTEAMSHLGARYRYGSKGPKTFDCSGFTSYVYSHQSGIAIGSSSREQYARNQPIGRNELRTGDLVFFTSPRSGRSVGHVGIVVDVDPITNTFRFIHASTTEGVKISNSTDSYYSRRYIGARRVNP